MRALSLQGIYAGRQRSRYQPYRLSSAYAR